MNLRLFLFTSSLLIYVSQNHAYKHSNTSSRGAGSVKVLQTFFIYSYEKQFKWIPLAPSCMQSDGHKGVCFA